MDQKVDSIGFPAVSVRRSPGGSIADHVSLISERYLTINITTNTTTIAKYGRGFLAGITISVPGTGSTVAIYDYDSASASRLICTLNTTTARYVPLNKLIQRGITLVTTGTAAAQIVLHYAHEKMDFTTNIYSNNLVPNGNFINVPDFLAATTSNDRVVDGRSSGSDKYLDQKRLFAWKTNLYNHINGSVQYDTDVRRLLNRASMKFHGEAVKERVHVHLGYRNYSDMNTADDIRENLIPIIPGKKYKAYCWVKISNAANVVVGSSFAAVNKGIGLQVYWHDFDGYKGAEHILVEPVDSEWQLIEREIVAPDDAEWANISFGLFGNSTNYFDADAWFSDISLVEA